MNISNKNNILILVIFLLIPNLVYATGAEGIMMMGTIGILMLVLFSIGISWVIEIFLRKYGFKNFSYRKTSILVAIIFYGLIFAQWYQYLGDVSFAYLMDNVGNSHYNYLDMLIGKVASEHYFFMLFGVYVVIFTTIYGILNGILMGFNYKK